MDETIAQVEFNELADELNRTGADQHHRVTEDGKLTDLRSWTEPTSELPIVVGVVGSDGKVRVNEQELEPGRYRVRAGAYGEIVGEISVLDPVVVRKSNRHDRRQGRQMRRYRLPPHPLAGVNRRSR